MNAVICPRAWSVWLSAMLSLLVLGTEAHAQNRVLTLSCAAGACCSKMSGPASAPTTDVQLVTSDSLALGVLRDNVISSADDSGNWLKTRTLPSDLVPLVPILVVTPPTGAAPQAQVVSPRLALIPRCQSAAVDWEEAARAQTLAELAAVSAINPEVTTTAGAVDEVVNELLKTIAQVALDTARRKGERAVMARLKSSFCDAKLSSGVTMDSLLPNSCALLATLRLDDLQIAARSLQNAAFLDGASVASKEVRTRLASDVSSTLGVDVLAALPRLTQALVQARMTGERAVVLQAATEAINGLAVENWFAVTAGTQQSNRCMVGLALVTMRACTQSGQLGTCDVPTLVNSLFEVSSLSEILTCRTIAGVDRARVQQLAFGGVRALRALTHPDPGTTPIGALVPSIEWLLSMAEDVKGTGISTAQSAALRLARATTQALSVQDFQLLLAAVAVHLSDNADSVASGAAIRRGSTVLQSAVAYAQTYEKADLKDAQAQRRKVIESLVDELNDRSSRAGESITTLGIPVGASVVGLGHTQGEWAPYSPQLSLPVTVALQLLPAAKGVGFHFGFSALDLGQYVSYESTGDVTGADWRTAFMVGGQVGLLLGSPDNLFLLGLEARYAPALFPDNRDGTLRAGATRFGLFAGYYVPLFDLN